MMKNETVADQISFRELVWGIIKKWRLVIMCIIAGGFISGGVRLINRIIHVNNPMTIEHAELAYENAKRDYDKTLNTIEIDMTSLEKQLDEMNRYCDNSVILKINPYKVAESTVSVFVDSKNDDLKAVNRLVEEAISYLVSGAAAKAIEGEIGIEARYIQELIKVGKYKLSGAENLSFTYGFEISVMGDQDELASKILEEILKTYEYEFFPVLIEKTEDFQFRIVGQGTVEKKDEGLATRQKDILNLRNVIEKELNNNIDYLADLDEPKVYVYTHEEIVLSVIKYLILGFVVGGCFGLLAAVLFVVLEDAEYNREDSDKKHTVWIRLQEKQSGIAERIDSWIYRKERAQCSLDLDSASYLISASVKKVRNIQNICVIDRVGKDGASVIKKLFSDSVKVYPQGDLSYIEYIDSYEIIIIIDMLSRGLKEHKIVESYMQDLCKKCSIISIHVYK